MPDATTIWLFREALVEAGLIDKPFDRFSQHLRSQGLRSRGGQIVDATIVSAPKQRNSKYENEAIKAGKTPGEWEKKPADARKTRMRAGPRSTARASMATRTTSAWTSCTRSSASGLPPTPRRTIARSSTDILDASNTGNQVWADSAYRSAEIEAKLAAKGLKSRIHRRAARNRPLSADTGSREHDALEGARACRACVRSPGELDGSQDRAHHRHGAGEVQDRDDEPRLQHAPTCTARAGGGCARS